MLLQALSAFDEKDIRSPPDLDHIPLYSGRVARRARNLSRASEQDWRETGATALPKPTRSAPIHFHPLILPERRAFMLDGILQDVRLAFQVEHVNLRILDKFLNS